jgi:methionyl-tRNA formyltransferase
MSNSLSFGIIGRSEWLFDTVIRLVKDGHKPIFIITAREAPEYSKSSIDFRHLAQNLEIPFLQTTKLSSAQAISFLDKVGFADCVVSVNYSSIITASTIDRFPLGVLNAHGGDLPRYRGSACQAWAILNGEEKIGMCVHRMIPDELDSGDIIARDYLPIYPDTKIKGVYNWFEEIIPQLYSNAFNKLSLDPDFILEAQSKDQSKIVRCFPRRPEDGEIDWSMPASQIVRLINASGTPFIGAYGTLEDMRVHFFSGLEIKELEKYYAVPGQLLRINESDKCVDVATGHGTLRLSEFKSSEGTEINFSKTFRSVRQRFIKNKNVNIEEN